MPLLGYHVPLLRAVADEIGLPTVAALARQPGASEVCRVTAHYYDRRACDSVGTVIKWMTGGAVLEMIYRHALDHKPLVYPVDADRARALLTALKTAGFDKLDDQPNLPARDAADVWLIERAAGTFYHSVVVAPEIVQTAAHRALMDAVRRHLPEALRMVK